MEPEKPFACSLPDCGMTFTNEDHLHVHTKKHDMALQLGMEQRAAFVADQTPTPTRFIRNCEEVGLFQDLQNVGVNPFDEGFKRAMEAKHNMLSLEGPTSNEDALHTPHLVFPLEAGDCTLYTTNNQRNITISRSSSDDSGAVKEYETTKISKLTNEVTTISRIVGKDILDRVTTTDDVSIIKHAETTTNKDRINETSVSFTNNVIKIHSNVEIRKDNINIDTKKTSVATNTDSHTKDTISIDGLLTDNKKAKLPPIMSQKSLDFVVDSLTSDAARDDNLANNLKRNYDSINKLNQAKSTHKLDEDYEVIIKLPNGKHVRMKACEETEKPPLTIAKEKLNKTIRNKIQSPVQRIQSIPNSLVQSIVPITTGTLIPVTIMNPAVPILHNIPKIPIVPLSSTLKRNFKTVKRKIQNDNKVAAKGANSISGSTGKCDEDVCIREQDNETRKNSNYHLESRSAASRRYRERLKQTMQMQTEENKHLREMNRRLTEEKAALQLVITQHLKDCPNGESLSQSLQEKLSSIK